MVFGPNLAPRSQRRWQKHAGSSIRISGRAAVRLVRETGKPIVHVARDLGIT